MIVPVILCGGSGTRLWPLSREAYPKQFYSLVEEETLLQSTIKRLSGLPGCETPLLVCNNQHRFLAAEQMRQIGVESPSILLEPVGRNTAPATACAALSLTQQKGDSVLFVLPADHIITDIQAFGRAVEIGALLAKQGKLVTFGIIPTAPETGYGYIKASNSLGTDTPAFHVDSFVEKPDLHTAQNYIESGKYYWNSGMFMFKAGRYLEELEQFAPEMLYACTAAYEKIVQDLDFLRLDAEAFADCPSGSIDYTIMEKTDGAVVVPLDAGWSDLGSWASLLELGPRDKDKNVVLGDVLTKDVNSCYLRSEARLLTAVGVKDLIVVDSSDALLVVHKDRVQDVKAIVNRLKASGRKESISHRKVYRPWGAYESIDVYERFQVKRITVKPGGILSLQMHHHRAEHWIIVRGTAKVTRGDEVLLLTEDQSTYIPLGVNHRLENPGVIPLDLIEVQTGSYLGEDDITRLEDVYGR
ncbi:MAG: mannose-1-phosphate guanylyltransferase/mannose-6-phosphate isomerase [Deltaproteobacteria bacterium]|nr:mannose-1-phosphate guanylyltransferase/mannose-6-phosphate isomerase [Deltaproteobacteria bacterium]MBW1718104.1 mannose-1-phosphate guanylyltransferase/mannose-6-phosphate isomerase [Deltaproteobacteria bacterium]MBW1938092.1 mannose-1-phosphate guanylyltransferase/mannose-6-phosphate isomerase [Deltaproteobacteria bacterium]MBW1963680.1 mannose-1-phosphate guanylyltransferase/mannose-6-phosphate isomerase [Deltaproteobacteria bacterium]